MCKYFKFPVGHPVMHVGDACKDKEACLRMEDLKMFYRSTREVSSRAPFPSQPETHVMSLANLRPNLQYR
jgi:hypothetical protein